MRMDETVHVDTVGTEGIEAIVPASYRRDFFLFSAWNSELMAGALATPW